LYKFNPGIEHKIMPAVFDSCQRYWRTSKKALHLRESQL
jgi:hypothetical protein